MHSIARDARHAVRLFAKSPAFAAVAVFTLAMGIGANTAIFSVANALLLRPLPFPQPERLVLVAAEKKATGVKGGPLSWPRFEFVRDHSRSFSGLAAFTAEAFNLSGRGDPEQVVAARVSWNFFEILGAKPALGRWFLPVEDTLAGEPVVLISHALWSRRFGANPAAVGERVTLDSRDFTIIGVLPDGFRFGLFPAGVDIVAPRVFDLNLVTPQQVAAGVMFLNYVGRLAPGSGMAQAQAEMDALAARYRIEYAKFPDADPALVVRVGNLRDQMVATARPAVLILFGAVALVLVIACANVSSLVLSRALRRGREIALRTALGATEGTVVRQLVTESLVLALLGGALGAILSSWGARLLAAMASNSLPRASEVHTDGYVLVFTLAVSLAAGVLFGLAPAMQVSRADLNSVLRSEGRWATSGRRRNALRSLLVVSQVALSMVLLAGAGLLVRNFAQLRESRPGFDAGGLLTMNISLPPARYAGAGKMTAFYDQLVKDVRTVPGVRAAAVSSALPLNPVRFSPSLPEGQPMVPITERPVFNIETFSPGYVETMRVPLLQGRDFTGHDIAGAPRVVMVNETLVRRYWPNQNPIGKHILLGRSVTPSEVVGVLGDVRNLNLAADVQPEIYLPFAQLPWPSMNLLVRAAGNPRALVSAVRARVLALDHDQPVTAVQTMDDVFEAGAAQPRFTTTLLGALALIALLMAMVGIYGVIAYSVAERTQEMGIRMALGADRDRILRLVLRQSLAPVLAGIGIGLAGALALTRLLAGQLYHVSVTDPGTFLAATVLLAAVAVLAAYVPARRATEVDPLVALHYE